MSNESKLAGEIVNTVHNRIASHYELKKSWFTLSLTERDSFLTNLCIDIERIIINLNLNLNYRNE